VIARAYARKGKNFLNSDLKIQSYPQAGFYFKILIKGMLTHPPMSRFATIFKRLRYRLPSMRAQVPCNEFATLTN
jgi:hypothetical protein